MVRTWSEEVGDARSVIEPIVKELLPGSDVEINTGGDLGVATAEVIVRRADREARCIVTFEAWERARNDPEQFRAALRQISADLGASKPLPAYLITSRGLDEKSAQTESPVLSTIAHGIEADVLAERFFTQGLRR